MPRRTEVKESKGLVKGRLAAAFGAMPEGPDRDAVRKLYARLLEENATSDKSLKPHLEMSIIPALAIHLGLQERGWDRSASPELIRVSVLEAARPTARFLRAAGRLPFFFSVFRVMCRMPMRTTFGPSGWDFGTVRDDSHEIHWDCTKCLCTDVFARHGAFELTDVFCQCDDVVYGGIPGAVWGRTRTLGRGDALRDFSFTDPRKK